MTDEEMAAKKATEKYPIPVCWNEIDLARNSCYEQGFLAGYTEEGKHEVFRNISIEENA